MATYKIGDLCIFVITIQSPIDFLVIFLYPSNQALIIDFNVTMENTNESIPPDLLAETAELLKRPSPRARESVRTTFSLSAEALAGLEWLVDDRGITKKEVFDDLCDFWVMLKSLKSDAFQAPLDFYFSTQKSTDRVRKTYVISDKARRTLEKEAKEYGVSRDVLVGSLILIAKSLTEAIEKERLAKHKKALEMIDDFWTKAEDLESELKDLLGSDDVIRERFSGVVMDIGELYFAIDSELKDGTPIDPYP